MDNLHRSIKVSETAIQASTKSIEHPEETIGHYDCVLQRYNASLSAIRVMEKDLENSKKENKDRNFNDKSETRHICKSAVDRLSTQITISAEPLRGQCQAVEAAIAEMKSERMRLDTELKGWRERIAPISGLVQHQKTHLAQSQSYMVSLNKILTSAKILPTEILIKIFEECAIARREDGRSGPAHSWIPDMEGKRVGDCISRYSCLSLSHVCRKWREVAWSAPGLLSHIGGYPYLRWSKSKIELFKQIAQICCPKRIDIIVNSGENLGWDLGCTTYEARPVISSVCVPSYHLEFKGITGFNDIYTFLVEDRLTSLSLIFKERYYDLRNLESFPKVELLELTLPRMTRPFLLNVQNVFPAMKCLHLTLREFRAGPTSQLFSNRLEKLYIRRDTKYDLPFEQPVQMPALHTISLLPVDRSIFKHIQVQMLHTLIYCAPKHDHAFDEIISNDSFDQVLRQIEDLTFLGWGRNYRHDGKRVIGMVGSMTKHTLQLKQLKFESCCIQGDSLVDLLKCDRLEGEVSFGGCAITLDRCTGITQNNCEEIMGIVSKLSVII